MKPIIHIFSFAVSFFVLTMISHAQIGELEFLPPDAESGEFDEYHKVKGGETLYQISQKHGVSVDYIQALNNLESHIIFPGQSLIVKTGSASSINKRVANNNQTNRSANLGVSEDVRKKNLAKLEKEDFTSSNAHKRILQDLPQEVTESTTVEKRTYYQVRKGDDIYSIADSYEVSPEQIKSWNAISRVYPGQAIIVGKRYEKANIEELRQTEFPEDFGNKRVKERNIAQAEKPESYGKSGSLSSLNVVDEMETPNPVSAEYRKFTTDNSSLGNIIEMGAFNRFVDPDHRGSRFYAEHKTLAPGTKISLLIPNNAGFVEVEVVRTLSPFSKTMIGLSPACLNLIDGAGGSNSVTIIY